MTDFAVFQQRVRDTLAEIGEETLRYNEDEFWMIERRYLYVEQYARENKLYNTSVALPLVRGLHRDAHRKASVIRDGVAYRLPYVIHCLMVTRMLIDLQLPLSRDEEDVVLASALCHDVIEDLPFEDGGREIMTRFHLDPRVYETVKLLSKRKDFTEEEETEHFRRIAESPYALLVKVSDRGNNVEDLYNMSFAKTREYIHETRHRILPMCDYAEEHYPHLTGVITILAEKMTTLTNIAEVLVGRYETQETKLKDRLARLTEENLRLRRELKELEELEKAYSEETVTV